MSISHFQKQTPNHNPPKCGKMSCGSLSVSPTFTTNPPPSTPPIQHPHHLQSTTFCTISIVATTTYTAFLFTTTIFIITYTASIFTTTSTPLGLAQNLCPGL